MSFFHCAILVSTCLFFLVQAVSGVLYIFGSNATRKKAKGLSSTGLLLTPVFGWVLAFAIVMNMVIDRGLKHIKK